MRAAYRVIRVVIGLVVLTLSVGWLLRRRRDPAHDLGAGPRLSVVPAPAAAPPAAGAVAPAEPPVRPATEPADQTATQPTAETLAEPAAEPAEPAEPENTAEPAETAATAAATEVAEVAAAAAAAETAGPTRQRASGGAEANGAAAVTADDLRQIRGVGPATESALHGLGIHTYGQIAGLDAAGRDRLQAALRDSWHRLDREDWVGQARELHRSKYGTDPGGS